MMSRLGEVVAPPAPECDMVRRSRRVSVAGVGAEDVVRGGR